jgi:hypothetical protein
MMRMDMAWTGQSSASFTANGEATPQDERTVLLTTRLVSFAIPSLLLPFAYSPDFEQMGYASCAGEQWTRRSQWITLGFVAFPYAVCVVIDSLYWLSLAWAKRPRLCKCCRRRHAEARGGDSPHATSPEHAVAVSPSLHSPLRLGLVARLHRLCIVLVHLQLPVAVSFLTGTVNLVTGLASIVLWGWIMHPVIWRPKDTKRQVLHLFFTPTFTSGPKWTLRRVVPVLYAALVTSATGGTSDTSPLVHSTGTTSAFHILPQLQFFSCALLVLTVFGWEAVSWPYHTGWAYWSSLLAYLVQTLLVVLGFLQVIEFAVPRWMHWMLCGAVFAGVLGCMVAFAVECNVWRQYRSQPLHERLEHAMLSALCTKARRFVHIAGVSEQLRSDIRASTPTSPAPLFRLPPGDRIGGAAEEK